MHLEYVVEQDLIVEQIHMVYNMSAAGMRVRVLRSLGVQHSSAKAFS